MQLPQHLRSKLKVRSRTTTSVTHINIYDELTELQKRAHFYATKAAKKVISIIKFSQSFLIGFLLYHKIRYMSIVFVKLSDVHLWIALHLQIVLTDNSSYMTEHLTDIVSQGRAPVIC